MDRSVIGFDRRVTLPWLELAAAAAARGDSLPEARAQLLASLKAEAGEEKDSDARKNTVGVLMRLWVRVPPERRAHRDRGLHLLERLEGQDRAMVHWGVSVAAYPFFYDVATHLGRLITLQDTVSLAALTQRMTESWGARSTVRRALQRVVRSMVAWGCLCEGGELGLFRAAEMRPTPDAEVAAWLLESVLRGSGSDTIALRAAGAVAALFPFQIELSVRDALAQPGLELHREGGAREVLALR